MRLKSGVERKLFVPSHLSSPFFGSKQDQKMRRRLDPLYSTPDQQSQSPSPNLDMESALKLITICPLSHSHDFSLLSTRVPILTLMEPTWGGTLLTSVTVNWTKSNNVLDLDKRDQKYGRGPWVFGTSRLSWINGNPDIFVVPFSPFLEEISFWHDMWALGFEWLKLPCSISASLPVIAKKVMDNNGNPLAYFYDSKRALSYSLHIESKIKLKNLNWTPRNRLVVSLVLMSRDLGDLIHLHLMSSPPFFGRSSLPFFWVSSESCSLPMVPSSHSVVPSSFQGFLSIRRFGEWLLTWTLTVSSLNFVCFRLNFHKCSKHRVKPWCIKSSIQG